MTYFVMAVLSAGAVYIGWMAFLMEQRTLGGLLMVTAGLAFAAYLTLWLNWLRLTPQERAQRQFERNVRKVDARRRRGR